VEGEFSRQRLPRGVDLTIVVFFELDWRDVSYAQASPGGVCPKRWRTTTLINHADAYPVDAAKRDWDKGALNRVWVGDITYLRTWQGWLYLATVIEAHSRRVIGRAIDEHMRADLVQDALTWRSRCVGTCRPRSCPLGQGTQYASAQITAFAAANGLTRSMGLTGICL